MIIIVLSVVKFVLIFYLNMDVLWWFEWSKVQNYKFVYLGKGRKQASGLLGGKWSPPPIPT